VHPYRIVIRGGLDVADLPLLDGATVARVDLLTVIELPVIDASHLDGVLAMLRDRGAALVSVQPVPAAPTNP
jgi:hypothetical protein